MYDQIHDCGNIIDGTQSRDTREHIDVCVVTFNSGESIGRLFESLALEPAIINVRMFDNASTDATVAVAEATATRLGLRINITVSNKNLGFPAACNRLLSLCESAIVVLVNPDVQLTRGALARLARIAAHDLSIGVVGCRQMTRAEQAQPEAARPRRRLRHVASSYSPYWFTGYFRRRRQASDAQLLIDRDVDCVSGALMVFRRALLSAVGYFDESVFMYLEDLDFSERVRRAGYRLRYVGTTWVWHDSGGSSRGLAHVLRPLMPQVWITYFARYGHLQDRLAVRPLVVLGCIANACCQILRWHSPRSDLAALWVALTYSPAAKPAWKG